MDLEDLGFPTNIQRLLLEQGISEFYPPQVEAFDAGVLEGRNLVLASPTASGKTLVAELCALRHILELDGKVLYLCPLRALASEKFSEFRRYSKIRKPDGRRIRITITTGDYDSSDPWLRRNDLIIATNEKADSLLRHRVPWMNDITLLIADEIHIIGNADRGPTLEVTLARLKQINPKIQILTLSATIRNAEELAEWLEAESVTLNWRPVKLREGVYYDGLVEFNDGSSRQVPQKYKNPLMNVIYECLLNKGQVLAFTNTRRSAVSLARRILPMVRKTLSKRELNQAKTISEKMLQSGERTRISTLLAELVSGGVAFHHAGLTAQQRRLIEDSFRSRRLKVLTATPTLAAGVNLPARTVVLTSYHRFETGLGRYPIPVLEYKQMSGRAGRPKYDKYGESFLLASSEEEQEYLMENYVCAQPEKIWSKLAVERIIRSHVLSTIASEFAHSEEDVYRFFNRTLYAQQYGPEAVKPIIGKVILYLRNEGMVSLDGSGLAPTPFGKRVSELYIDPVSAVVIREGLSSERGKPCTLSILHLICHTPDLFPRFYLRRKEESEMKTYLDLHHEEFLFAPPYGQGSSEELLFIRADSLSSEIDLESFLAELKAARVLESWIEEVSEDGIIERFHVQPGDLYRLVETSQWLLNATLELSRLLKQDQHRRIINEVHRRVRYGVKRELLPLVGLEDVGRVRGRMLFNSGLRSLPDLRKVPLSTLVGIPTIGPRVAKKIKEQVGGVFSENSWRKLDAEAETEQKPITDFKHQ